MRSRRMLYLLCGVWLGVYLGLMFVLSGCSGYRVKVQGVDVTDLKRNQILLAAGGALAAAAVHELAHIAVIEAKGYDWRFEGTTIRYDAPTDDAVQQAGFLAMIGIGAILNVVPQTKASAFTLGFNAASALGAISYPARYGDGGDHQGDDDLWLRDSALTTANTLWTVYNRREVEVPHERQSNNSTRVGADHRRTEDGQGEKRGAGVEVPVEEELQGAHRTTGQGQL